MRKEPPVHYTLAEQQELSKYYRGPENYSQIYRDYSPHPAPPEEDRYGKFDREVDVPHSPSGVDHRNTTKLSPRDIEAFLSTGQNHFMDDRFPNEIIPSTVFGEYLPSGNRNHQIPERIEQQFTFSQTTSLPLYRTAASLSPSNHLPPRYSPTSMNRSSQVTYPIADQGYLNYLSESHRFSDNEDRVSTRTGASLKSEHSELQVDTLIPSNNTSQQCSPCGEDDSSYQKLYSLCDSDALSARPRLIPHSSISSGTTSIATPSSTTSFTSNF